MNKLNMFSATLVSISLLLFFSSYFYHQHTLGKEVKYSKTITSITSTLTANHDSIRAEPSLTSKSYTVTEERGILIVMLFCVFLLVASVILNFIGHRRFGENRIHLPLSFSAVLIAIMIFVAINKIGLHIYA